MSILNLFFMSTFWFSNEKFCIVNIKMNLVIFHQKYTSVWKLYYFRVSLKDLDIYYKIASLLIKDKFI